MKLDIYNTEKQKVSSTDLPIQFNEEFRPDLIKRQFTLYNQLLVKIMEQTLMQV